MSRLDPIAKWFSAKQKLLGKKLTLPKLPPVEISDDDPPALRKKRKCDEQLPTEDIKFDVETLLGCYNPRRKRITIWRKGIEFCCEHLRLKPPIRQKYDKLFELILVHELGHWFHNETKPQKWQHGKKATLATATTEYSEAWAQWFAWVYANEKGGDLRELFLALENNQSDPYKAWRVFSGCPTKETDCMFEQSKQKTMLHLLTKLRLCGDLTFENIKREVFEEGLDKKTRDAFGDLLARL